MADDIEAIVQEARDSERQPVPIPPPRPPMTNQESFRLWQEEK